MKIHCIDNTNYPETLTIGKVYRVVPDRKAEEIGWYHILDDTGEDSIYPARLFEVEIETTLWEVGGES